VSITSSVARLRPRRGAVPWSTIGLLAGLMAYADGFWLTSVQGAVGAIQRSQSPFASWLQDSTLMLPLYVLAAVGALAFARRRLGPVLRRPRKVVAAVLMVAVAGSLLGTVEMLASATYDYHLQVEQLAVMHAAHHTPTSDAQEAAAGCLLCTQDQLTLEADERAARYASAGILATNVVLVGWAVALQGGRLERGAARPRRAQSVPEPSPGPEPVPA
jgi:hypothetical protein